MTWDQTTEQYFIKSGNPGGNALKGHRVFAHVGFFTWHLRLTAQLGTAPPQQQRARGMAITDANACWVDYLSEVHGARYVNDHVQSAQ